MEDTRYAYLYCTEGFERNFRDNIQEGGHMVVFTYSHKEEII